MVILRASSGNPAGFKESGRYYSDTEDWDKQSEDLRGKPWEEIFDFIQKQFEYKRLDMKKLKGLLRLLPKSKTNWPKVISSLYVFFNEHEKERKKYRWGDLSHTEADELRCRQKKLLEALRLIIIEEKGFVDNVGVLEEDFDGDDLIIDKHGVEKIEKKFDLRRDGEDKKQFDYIAKPPGKYDMQPSVRTRGGVLAMDSSYSKNQHVGEYYKSEKAAKKISSERGARAARKEERRYF